jgi:hypothetical protein
MLVALRGLWQYMQDRERSSIVLLGFTVGAPSDCACTCDVKILECLSPIASDTVMMRKFRCNFCYLLAVCCFFPCGNPSCSSVRRLEVMRSYKASRYSACWKLKQSATVPSGHSAVPPDCTNCCCRDSLAQHASTSLDDRPSAAATAAVEWCSSSNNAYDDSVLECDTALLHVIAKRVCHVRVRP